MGVSNFDAIALPAGGTITVGGVPFASGLTLIGKGSTPATGWTSVGSGQYATKTVTVAGAAVGDLVSVTIDAGQLTGTSPASVEMIFGRITAANTLTLYYVQWATAAFGTNVSTQGASTTISGAVIYAVQR